MGFFKCSCDCNSTDPREGFPLCVVVLAQKLCLLLLALPWDFLIVGLQEKRRNKKSRFFFLALFLSLLVSLIIFFFLSFDKKCRASLETLSVLIWYAFPAFCCLWVQGCFLVSGLPFVHHYRERMSKGILGRLKGLFMGTLEDEMDRGAWRAADHRLGKPIQEDLATKQ